MNHHYTCHFDGSCWPNPGGKMGMGAYIIDNSTGEIIFEHASSIEADENNSNNVAEYEAVFIVLRHIRKLNISQANILITGDSNLVIMQMSFLWKIKGGMYKNSAIAAELMLDDVVKLGNHVFFQWIPREQNQKADGLSKAK